MVTPTHLSLGIAFLAGLASFLSPCVLSLVPAYLGYLGGRAAGGEIQAGGRWRTFSHALAFVFGFSIVFMFFNIIAGALGLLLADVKGLLARLGGLLVFLFGLHMTGLLRIPFLEYDLRIHSPARPSPAYLSSFLMGIIFSAGWSPCTGPTLGLIMTLALNSQSALKATILGLAFSAGLALPFLVAALGIGWVTALLSRHASLMRKVEVAMGLLLMTVGILLVLGSFGATARWFRGIDFGL